MSIPSVPKIYALGSRGTHGIFEGRFVVEEKYDGSQFTFGLVDGKLVCRSKGAIIDKLNPGMFKDAVAVAQRLAWQLVPGWLYLCEYLAKEKHNVLRYSRPPKNFLVLYDIRTGNGVFSSVEAKRQCAEVLGLEPVQTIIELSGLVLGPDLSQYLGTESSLGGTKVEGVVVKNYGQPHSERSDWPLTAKWVSDAFKELKPRNPKAGGPGEFVQSLINSLRTEARWLKAVQHLREGGALRGENSDIGPLCREVQKDILEEEQAWIKEKLFKEFSKEIIKGSVNGFAQWYQAKLDSF
jgi:hypothetical protein